MSVGEVGESQVVRSSLSPVFLEFVHVLDQRLLSINNMPRAELDLGHLTLNWPISMLKELIDGGREGWSGRRRGRCTGVMSVEGAEMKEQLMSPCL